MIADTTFLIDLEREVKRQVPGKAAAFLSKVGDATIAVSIVAAAELSEGFPDSGRASAYRFLKHFAILEVDSETGWIWSRLSRQVRSDGRTIGDNDLWIAATAARHARPLVTRNTRDFQGLPGVVLADY